MDEELLAAPRRVRPTTPPPAVGLRYAPGLDGLRGLAVAAVLAYHSDAAWGAGGFLGVELFFTLSGYLVTALLLAEILRRGRVDLGAFYRARGRRLLPALLVCVVGTMVLYGIVLTDGPDLRADVLSALGYVQNWHLVLAHVPYAETFERPSPLLHLWSLAVEGQLYVVWPLLLVAVWGVSRNPRTVAVVALGCAALSTALMTRLYDADDVSRVYYGSDTRAAGFLIGAALAVLLRPRPARPRPVPPWVERGGGIVVDLAGGAALVALVVALTATSEFDENLYRDGGFARSALLTALVIAAAVRPAGLLGAVLSRAPMVWLGKRSYGIYLYHWPIFALTRPGIDLPDHPLLVNAGRIAVTLVIAELSYRYVELPVRRGALTRWVARFRPAVFVSGACVLVAALSLSCGPPLPGPPAASPAPPAVPSSAAPAIAAQRPTDAIPATSTPAPAATTPVIGPAQAPAPPAGGPLVVGDSVVLGSADALRAALGQDTTVDAVVGRQFTAGPGIVAAWVASHPGPVVVHLGSNGIVRDRDLDAIVDAARGRRLVLVNVAVPRRWQEADNTALRRAADRRPGQVVLVDWAAIVAQDPGLLGPDRVHPTGRGRTALAAAVRAAIEQ